MNESDPMELPMSNKTTRFARLATASALVTTGLLTLAGSSPVVAQYRVGSDGRALDANNRIGSGGYNSGGTNRPLGPSGNDIVTGNVTGGKQFRGNVPYTDAGAFRGRTSDFGSDTFVRESAGVPTGGVDNNNAARTTSYFGSSRAAPPPQGFTPQGTTGGYIPAGPTASRSGSDLRLGTVVATPQTVLPPPGGLLLPGPVDATTGTSVITASPLYGVRQWSDADPAQRQFVDRFAQDAWPTAPDAMQLDTATLDRFRQELNNTAQQRTPVEGAGERGANDPQSASPALPDSTLAAQPAGAAGDNALANTGLSTDRLANTGLNEGPVAGTSTRNQIVTPMRQSALFARLQQQFERQGKPMTDQEAQRRFQLERNVRDQITRDEAAKTAPRDRAPLDGDKAEDPARPKAMRPIRPGGLDATTQESGAANDQPVKVSSLAEGTTAPGLASLLTGAEASMKAGQFGAAIDRYDAAAKVAPNNPLITLGRANAQLGASYYGRAESDLRKAFATGPALLEGQYDLITFLGEERLQFIINDLKQIARDEPTQPGPTFLLAYIARNMGNPRLAGDYLTETEKRSGGPDPLIATMRRVWRIPAATE
jgi:hypothetical protein